MNAALDAINTASRGAVTHQLTLVLDLPSWVETLVSARPFDSTTALLALAQRTPWTEDELRRTVAGRPRLGGPIAATNTYSRGEQAALVDERWRDERLVLESAYEEQFGMRFLIRAAGRSADDVLAELRRRLGNLPGEEIVEVERELREITLLRLRGLLDPDGAV